MGRKKKAPREKVPKSAAADMARATIGKSRTFKDRSKMAPKADPEIEDGVQEYEDGKA